MLTRAEITERKPNACLYSLDTNDKNGPSFSTRPAPKNSKLKSVVKVLGITLKDTSFFGIRSQNFRKTGEMTPRPVGIMTGFLSRKPSAFCRCRIWRRYASGNDTPYQVQHERKIADVPVVTVDLKTDFIQMAVDMVSSETPVLGTVPANLPQTLRNRELRTELRNRTADRDAAHDRDSRPCFFLVPFQVEQNLERAAHNSALFLGGGN